ncbi:MAG: trigger factor [Nitrospirae bacterium]|nr:trigger factor [Nitrospirota bacterium]
MLNKVEALSPTTKRLQINIPPDVIKSETDSVYSKLRTTTRIPGFRPGKVPQAILEKRFSKNVEAEVIEKIVPRYYLEALKEANLEPVSYPNIDDKIEIVPGQPLSFSVTVEVKPEIGDIKYEGIVLREKAVIIEEEDVEKTLKLMQESKALFTVTEEALNEDDMAIIDCNAFVDGNELKEMSYKEYPMLLGPDAMPREFVSALIGKKKGDTVEAKITMEQDNPNKAIAGKEVLFKINITEAKKKNVPPLDDEFAKEAECGSLDELKNRVRENLSARKKSQINLEYKKDILNELINKHAFDIPDSMLHGEIESLIYQAKQNAERKGEAITTPEEELKRQYEVTAKENVKGVLLLEAIGRQAHIEVSDADVKEAVGEIAARNGLKPEEVMRLYSMREGSMDAMKSRLFADKVLEFILGKATIEN